MSDVSSVDTSSDEDDSSSDSDGSADSESDSDSDSESDSSDSSSDEEGADEIRAKKAAEAKKKAKAAAAAAAAWVPSPKNRKSVEIKTDLGTKEHKPKVQERRSEGSMISSGERWHTKMEELWLTIVTRVPLEGMDSGLEQVKSCYKFRENASSMRRLR